MLVLIVALFGAKNIIIYLHGTVASDSIEDVKTYYEGWHDNVDVYGSIEEDNVIYYAVRTNQIMIAEFSRLKNGRLEEQACHYGDGYSYVIHKTSSDGNYLLIASDDNIAKIVFQYNGKVFPYEIESAKPGLYKFETESVNSNY